MGNDCGRLSSSEWIWDGQPIQLPDNTLLLREEKSALKAAEMEKTAPAGLIESACVVQAERTVKQSALILHTGNKIIEPSCT